MVRYSSKNNTGYSTVSEHLQIMSSAFLRRFGSTGKQREAFLEVSGPETD
jgi:hypothetical protein